MQGGFTQSLGSISHVDPIMQASTGSLTWVQRDQRVGETCLRSHRRRRRRAPGLLAPGPAPGRALLRVDASARESMQTIQSNITKLHKFGII
jgi:hypothetical protein